MAQPQGVSVAFGQAALTASPTWTQIDRYGQVNVVQRWQMHRGRVYMTDRTEAGTAQVDFIDTAGVMDPTRSTGPFYPMNPNCPFAIAVWHPYDLAWYTVYTGLVQQIPQTVDVSSKFTTGSLNASDLFSLLALSEIPPGVAFGAYSSGPNTVASSKLTVGETTYQAQTVQDRLKAILADALIPAAMTSIFTGNVNVQYTIYPPGTQTLAALQDAADAEFPGVANLYCDKTNRVTFHGRLSRFNPTGVASGTDWVYTVWNASDTSGGVAHAGYATISGLTFDRDVEKIKNAGLFSPDNISDAAIPGQLAFDAGSITTYGPRIYSAANLITLGGVADGYDANTETKTFSTYVRDNMHAPQNLVSQLVFRGFPGATKATWDIITKCDIGDRVNVTSTHPGGGGFNLEPYYIDGITYTATPSGQPPIADITMTLDLSPVPPFPQTPFS